MGRSLVIVESPAKAKTINKYLGADYKVMASMGHVRDLPTNRLGVDLGDEFLPDYDVMPSKRKVMSELKTAAKNADRIYLAADPDREGEAICWHLKEAVIPENKPSFRVLFNEITKSAVQQAVKNPLALNMHLVDAQQARRILDRLVGYLISPVLWKKVKRGISAGRVQSVALRMIVTREFEILSFVPIEYWTFNASLEGPEKPIFSARLIKWDSQTLRQGIKDAKRTIANQSEADAIEAVLKKSDFIVQSVQKKAKKQSPPLPFTTSKLQQDASRGLGFSVKKTMMVAQSLYEGKEIKGEPMGLITYMRTDSTRVSEEAIGQVRNFIGANYPPDYLPAQIRRPKQKSNIQDGHEAIRPTDVTLHPDSIKNSLTSDEFRLYSLIWKRFVASQMTAKQMNETVIGIAAGPGLFEARGIVTTFPGYTILFKEPKPDKQDNQDHEEGPGDTAELPNLSEGQQLDVRELEKKQNVTKPPARYNEASLVKALEENGIGRPSTYATIIATIQNRDYVEKRESRFYPSELGIVVAHLLTQSFPDLMDIQYTARLENLLDDVENGKLTWKDLLGEFYKGFEVRLQEAEANMPNIKRDGLTTDLKCDTCGSPMVIKTGKYGQFLSCSRYPECAFAQKIKEIDPSSTDFMVLKGMVGQEKEAPQSVELPCPECGGDLVRRKGKFGEFIACSKYPECRYVHRELLGVTCPKPDCDGHIQVRKTKRGKLFYGCTNYPKCDFISWNKPLGEQCPSCGAPTLFEKQRRNEAVHFCENTACGFKREPTEPNEHKAAV